MTEPQVVIFESLAELGQAAAARFGEAVRQAAAAGRPAFVALSGGTAPQELFRCLARPPFQAGLPWEQVHFFWGDERCVPPGDPESSYALAKGLLFDYLPVPPENIHRALGELAPAEAAARYTAELARFGEPARPWPRFDLVLLGMGADGHTASLFPGQVNPGEDDQAVIAVTASYQDRPANRVSLTPPVFNSARAILFLAPGQSKAAALAQALAPQGDPLRHPTRRIHPPDGSVTWLVDRAAAALLPPMTQIW